MRHNGRFWASRSKLCSEHVEIGSEHVEIAMPTLIEELSARAKALPAEDRARLAEELLESLQEDADLDAEAAWDREIEHRVAEIESGTARLIPAEEVHAEARRLIRR